MAYPDEPQGPGWQQALSLLLPAAASALGGGGVGLGAFGEQYARGAAVADELRMRQQADLAQQQRWEQEYALQQAQEERIKQDREIQNTVRALEFLDRVPTMRETALADAEAAGALYPDQQAEYATKLLQDAFAKYGKIAQPLGVTPELLMAQVGDLRGHASTRMLKSLLPKFKALTDEATPEQMEKFRQDATPRPEFGGLTFADFERLLPPAERWVEKTKRPSLQSKNVRGLLDGKPYEGMADYDPTGRGYTVEGKPLTNVKDAPPAPTIQVNTNTGLPTKLQNQVNGVARTFESNATVKNYQRVAESVQFVQGLDPKTANPADDQALIYAFAKAMDPDSVVREGEYATVQKYAQSWVEKIGFDARRVLSNSEFLTPQARANMKKTILSKGESLRQQYQNLRKSYAKRINRITGGMDGDTYLTDFDVMWPEAGAVSPGKIQITDGKGNFFEAPEGTPIPKGYTKVGG